jgi:hypothetical protein
MLWSTICIPSEPFPSGIWGSHGGGDDDFVLQAWISREYVSLKGWYPPASLHGVRTQKNKIVIFPSGLQPKFCTHFSSSPTCYMPRPSHRNWFDHNNNIQWRLQIMKRLIMKFSSALCHFIPLRSKHSPPQHPQSVFLIWQTTFHTYTNQHAG